MDGNGITNEPPHFLDLDAMSGRNELIIAREPLKKCSFAERKRSILIRMPKPPIAESVELSRDGGCWHCPRYSDIDGRIPFTSYRFVAIRDQIIFPISPGPPWFGRSDTPRVRFGQSACAVESIVFIHITMIESWKIADLVLHSPVTIPMRWRGQLNLTEARSQENQTRAHLSESKIRSVQDTPCNVVFRRHQSVDELPKGFTASEIDQPGHILHGNNLGPDLVDQTFKGIKKLPVRIVILLIVRREWLARCASY